MQTPIQSIYLFKLKNLILFTLQNHRTLVANKQIGHRQRYVSSSSKMESSNCGYSPHHWLHCLEILNAQHLLDLWQNGLRRDGYTIFYNMYFTARTSLRLYYLSECITFWSRWNNFALFYWAFNNHRYGFFLVFI